MEEKQISEAVLRLQALGSRLCVGLSGLCRCVILETLPGCDVRVGGKNGRAKGHEGCPQIAGFGMIAGFGITSACGVEWIVQMCDP